MKTTYSIPITVVATALFVAAGIGTLHAQTWQTVDDFQHAAGFAAAGSAIATDASGTALYAVGGANTDPNGNQRLAIVTRGLAEGTDWSTLPQPAEPVYAWEHYRAITVDASGRLLAGGNGHWTSGSDTWLIRESTNGGLTWTTTDTLPGDNASGCSDVAIHPVTGDTYASGSSGTIGGLVRKRTAGAAEFVTVYEAGPGDIGSGWAIGFLPNGSVIVPGNRVDPATRAMTWAVRRSPNGEPGTWTEETFNTREWKGISAGGVLVTGNTVYLSGWAYNSQTRKNHWVVRASTDGGATWTLSDNFTFGGSSVQVFEMAADLAGNVYVCGQASDKSGKLFWIVRKGGWATTVVKGKPVTKWTWTTSDAFQLAAGREAMALDLTVDAAGKVFACGRAQDAGGIEHFIVRRLAP